MAKDISPKTHFRGYAIPGPSVPGDPGDAEMSISEGETLDVLCGHFRIFQLRKGHRYSTDDVLTAWYGTSWCPSARTILDLGSGIGTVAMVSAWRLPAARVVTVEAQRESIALMRKSVAWNGLKDRFDIREGDLHLQTGGIFACVFPVTPAEQAERVVGAARAANLTIVRQRPIVLREGEPPLLGVFVMMRREDLPELMQDQTWHEPSLVIRREDGSVHLEYAAVKLSFGFPP